MAKEESNSLDEYHVGKRDADAGGGFGREVPDKGSVDDIVECRDHHADHGGYGQPHDQSGDWRFGHLTIFVFEVGHCFYLWGFLFIKN